MDISIIMPSYNYGRFITDAMHSLFGGTTSLGEFAPQTIQSFEVIIVDDASEDETAETAQSLTAKFPNVSYIRNAENLGTAGALNAGIRQAQGEFITFLSADDMMETTRLEKMLTMARTNPHSCVYDDLKMFASGQRTMHMPMPDYDFDKLLYKNTMHAGILYPRKAWEESGGYPEAFKDGREDWAFNVAIGRAGYCGVHVKEPLYLYRWERQNRSLRNAGVDWRITFLNKMQATFPDLYRGERPKMCCGNNKKKAVLPATKSASASRRAVPQQYVEPELIVGSEGMMLLEYQLSKAGPVIYVGEVTKQRYVFGGKHKRGLVDSRDAPALIQRIEDRRHAFAYAQPVVAFTPEPEPAPAATNELATEPIKEEMTTLPALAVAEPTPAKPKKRGKSA